MRPGDEPGVSGPPEPGGPTNDTKKRGGTWQDPPRCSRIRSLLSRLDRVLLPVERFCALLSGIAIFSLMFMAVYSVGGRKFFASPLLGYID